MRRRLLISIAAVIVLALFAAATQAAGPEMPKGKEFVSKTAPVFSVIYPSDLAAKPLETPAEAIRVAASMGLPAFVGTVYDAPKGASLKTIPQSAVESAKKDARYSSKTGWKLESQQETKLVDGTPAVEYEFGWDWQPGVRLQTRTVTAIKGGKMVSWSVTTTEPGNAKYLSYLRSLKFR